MSRFGQRGGRFDQRHELDNIFEGTEQDLQDFEGQTILWFVFDSATSVSDPVYSVGSRGTGRVWKPAVDLPVLTVQRTEGAEGANDQGFYVTDTVHVSLSMRQAENAGLGDLVNRADPHLFDRFIWQGNVFSPVRIQARGLLQFRHVVAGIDATQVNPEELVNDDQFAQYVNNGPGAFVNPTPPAGDPAQWYDWQRHNSNTTPPIAGTDPLYG